MVSQEQGSEAAAAILREFRSVSGFSALPSHVGHRVAALLGAESLLYADSNVDITRGDGAPDTLNGRIIAFSADVVVLLVLTGVTARPDSDVAATVDVQVWSRRDLKSVMVGGSRNTDDVWAAGQQDSWPRGAIVGLFYDGRPEPVVLPLSDTGAARLGDFMPSLTKDLAR